MFQEQNVSIFTVQQLREKYQKDFEDKVIDQTESSKNRWTIGCSVMPDIEKDLQFLERIINRSTGNIFGMKKTSKFQKKARRVRKKTVKCMNDQECAVYPGKSMKMHL